MGKEHAQRGSEKLFAIRKGENNLWLDVFDE